MVLLTIAKWMKLTRSVTMMTLIKTRAESTKMLIEHMIYDLIKDFFEELYFIMEITKLLAKSVRN